MNLPFTNNIKGGNKKSFKILTEKQLKNKTKKDSSGLLNFVKKIIYDNSNNSNKINYIKASQTKDYYKNI